MMSRVAFLVLTLFVVVVSGVPVRADLIQNGGFETGDLQGWYGYASYSGVVPSGWGGIPAYEGNYYMSFGSPGGFGFLAQDVLDLPGRVYTLDIELAHTGYAPGYFQFLQNEFKIEWDGAILYDKINDTNHGYTLLSYYVVGTGLDTLRFDEFDKPGYFGVDAVSLGGPLTANAVPEPAALTLVGIGVVLASASSCLRRQIVRIRKPNGLQSCDMS